jgi:hypothetical protein
MSNSGKLAIYGNAASSITAFLALVDGSDNITYWNGSDWSNITSATAGTDYTLAAGTGDLAGYTVLTVTAVLQECPYELVGDFNSDCKVNFKDFAIIAGNWLTDCTYPNCLTNPLCY